MDLIVLGVLAMCMELRSNVAAANERQFHDYEDAKNNNTVYSGHVVSDQTRNRTLSQGYRKIEHSKLDTVNERKSSFNEDSNNSNGSTRRLCTEQKDVLFASNEVKVLSIGAYSSNARDEQALWHWTIVPWHKKGSVSVMKRDNIVSEDIFKEGCSNVHLFHSDFNRTNGKWCQDARLLPCQPVWQIQYHIYGYSPVSEPGMAIKVVSTPADLDYDTRNNDSLSLYYYECGGIRTKGLIRPPRFPSDVISTRNSVYCKWDLLLEKGYNYGILRFSGFKLPDCKNQHLTILQDTLLQESEVVDSLMDILRGEQNYSENSKIKSTEYDGGGEDIFKDNYFEVYRDERITAVQAEQNPKKGIHLIEKKRFCGQYRPKKNFAWRKGNKRVSIIFQSQNSTLRGEGFSARLSVHSRKITLRYQKHANLNQTGESGTAQAGVSRTISSYIAMIILIPIVFSAFLSVMICRLKQSTPSSGILLKSYQEKSNTKSRSSHMGGRDTSMSTARPSSFRLRSADTHSPSLAKRDRGFRSTKRKGSIINVKNLIGKRKSSLRLKTVYEEESSNQSKSVSLLLEEQKGTEPTDT